MNLFYLIIGVVFGGTIGYEASVIKELSKKLQERPVVEAGATKGEYGPVNEYMVNQPDKGTGLVMPKTPQQLEWEEEEQLRKANP